MHIKSIYIESFKGFNRKSGSLLLDNLNSGLNLLVGHPNTGKTSVLEAAVFGLSHPPSKQFDRLYSNWHPETTFQTVNDFVKLFPFNSKKTELKISIESHNGQRQDCRARWQTDDFGNDSLHITDTAETPNSDDRPQRTISLMNDLNGGLMAERKSPEQYFPSMDIEYTAFSRTFVPTLEDSDLETLKDLAIEQRLWQLLRPMLPAFKQMRLNGRELIFYDDQDRPMPLSYMGSGIIKIARLILSLFTWPNRVLLIDEIADSLHPQSILQLLRILLPLIKEQNIQVIATSHSFDILDVLAQNYESFSEYHQSLQIHRFLCQDNGPIKVKQSSWKQMQAIFPTFIDVRVQ